MYVFVKTNNPRPTFHLDMTPAERELMTRHIAYWSEKAERGIAVVFGPVLDPAGVYGIGVYRVDDVDHMQRMIAQDPALGLLSYTVLEMPQVVIGRGGAPAAQPTGAPST